MPRESPAPSAATGAAGSASGGASGASLGSGRRSDAGSSRLPLGLPPPWALALLAAAALLHALSAVQVGFLTDDFLIVNYLDRASGSVRWDRVLGEFSSPWFHVRDLWRPIVTLSYALQVQLHGFSAPLLHAANVAMLLVAAIATATIVNLRLPMLRGAFAAGAGLLVLLHPAAIEPGHWIAARTTALEVMFSALCLAAYAAFLFGRLRSRWPAFVLMALALGSKEGAITLALSLTAIDLLCTRGSLPARVQGLRPFWILLFAWLLWRKVVLGVFTTAESGHDPAALAGAFVTHAGWVAMPPGTWLRWLLLPAWGLLLWPLLKERPGRSALYAGWLAVLLAPALHVPSGAAAWDGRLVFSGLPALALWASEAAATHRRQLLAAVAGVVLLCVSGLQSVRLAAHYRLGGGVVAAFQAQLLAYASAAAPGRPLAPVTFASDLPLHLLQPELWGLLALRPFAARDEAVCGLPHVLPQAGSRTAAECDATPALAVLDAGGRLAELGGPTLVLHALPPQPPGVAMPVLRRVDAVAARFRAETPWAPLAGTVLEVTLPEAATSCAVRLASDLPDLLAFGVRTVTTERPASTFWFDLGSATTGLVLHRFAQPWPDLVVEVGGAPAPAGTSLTVHHRPAALDVPTLRGAIVTVEDLAQALAPPFSAGELHLLLPTTAVVLRVEDGRLVIPGAAATNIAFARDVLGSCLVHCCWRIGDGTAPPRRSALDWFHLR